MVHECAQLLYVILDVICKPGLFQDYLMYSDDVVSVQ